MDLYEKLKKLGNKIGVEIWGYNQGAKLLQNFANSFDLPRECKFEVKINKGNTVVISPQIIRTILISSIQMCGVTRREAAIALLKWKLLSVNKEICGETVESDI